MINWRATAVLPDPMGPERRMTLIAAILTRRLEPQPCGAAGVLSAIREGDSMASLVFCRRSESAGIIPTKSEVSEDGTGRGK